MFLAESLAGTTSAVDLELIKEKKIMLLIKVVTQLGQHLRRTINMQFHGQ